MGFVKIGTVVVCLVGLSGCWWKGLGEKYDRENQATVRQRATFEMSCDDAKLRLTCVKRQDWGNEMCHQWGVEGCGKRGVYVEANPGSGEWILNSSAGATAADSASTAEK